MKTLHSFTIILIAVVVGGFVLVTSKTNEVFPQTQAVKDGRVLGVHHLSLLDGVDAASFEGFITDEFEPVAKGIWPGIEIIVMKGERNADSGEYLLVYDIQSLWIRDFFYPSEGEPTEAAAAINARCGEKCSVLWEKLYEMAERTDWADFVELEK